MFISPFLSLSLSHSLFHFSLTQTFSLATGYNEYPNTHIYEKKNNEDSFCGADLELSAMFQNNTIRRVTDVLEQKYELILRINYDVSDNRLVCLCAYGSGVCQKKGFGGR